MPYNAHPNYGTILIMQNMTIVGFWPFNFGMANLPKSCCGGMAMSCAILIYFLLFWELDIFFVKFKLYIYYKIL